MTTYQYAANNPLLYVDVNGDSLIVFGTKVNFTASIKYGSIALSTEVEGIGVGFTVGTSEKDLIGYRDSDFYFNGMKNGFGPQKTRNTLGIGLIAGASQTREFENGEKVTDKKEIDLITAQKEYVTDYKKAGAKSEIIKVGVSQTTSFIIGYELGLNIEMPVEKMQRIRLDYSQPSMLNGGYIQIGEKANSMNGNNAIFDGSSISREDKEKITNYVKSLN
jgi:hypothetical protein